MIFNIQCIERVLYGIVLIQYDVRSTPYIHTMALSPPESPPLSCLSSPQPFDHVDVHGRTTGANFTSVLSLYPLYRLNLILRFSESHVYFRVTADTFFRLPSFDENLRCSCPWYQSLVKSNDLILIR